MARCAECGLEQPGVMLDPPNATDYVCLGCRRAAGVLKQELYSHMFTGRTVLGCRTVRGVTVMDARDVLAAAFGDNWRETVPVPGLRALLRLAAVRAQGVLHPGGERQGVYRARKHGRAAVIINTNAVYLRG